VDELPVLERTLWAQGAVAAIKVVSGDRMMNKACGPVWHTKQKAQGSLSAGPRGVDKEASGGKRHSDGWMYGHGSLCLVSPGPGVLGTFNYMRYSAHMEEHAGSLRPVKIPQSFMIVILVCASWHLESRRAASWDLTR
jgi:hypothetical protein